MNVLLADINAWVTILLEGVSSQKARTVRQFSTLLTQFLLPVPGHRIYKRHDQGNILGYYVRKIEYEPPSEMRDHRRPACTVMFLAYESIGGRKGETVRFEAADCLHMPVQTTLVEQGYRIETPELRAEYLKDKKRYVAVVDAIGKQFWAAGVARVENTDRWSYTSSVYQLDKYGEPSRVVIDVFNEDGKSQHSSDYVSIDAYHWINAFRKETYDPLTDEDESESEKADEDTILVRPQIEVPIHPWVMIFHLGKHQRMQAHVNQLEEYVYDENLKEKLILPSDQKGLVELLIETKGGAFQDIVRGKTGGAVVLLSGPPGTGKTLTAEVYAESEKRPLYSVQCSQLGMTPEKLEEQLLKVFDRARRWNAVLLLDEADVYVHARGVSMQQNAIVGVFLRVLEYQNTILFLTTNRPDDVDDAIASRCIARLSLGTPSLADARRIWQVLSDNSNIPITSAVIDQVVKANPHMTGRDIKNILKLAALMTKSMNSVSPETIEYVKQFKPTGE